MNAKELCDYQPFIKQMLGDYRGPYSIEILGEASIRLWLPTPEADFVVSTEVKFATNNPVSVEIVRGWEPSEELVAQFTRKNHIEDLQRERWELVKRAKVIEKELEELLNPPGVWIVKHELMFSSHDDAIAIFSTEALAQAYVDKRNSTNCGNELCDCLKCKNTFYYSKILIKRGYGDEGYLEPGSEWLVTNRVPSVGEFIISPKEGTEIQTLIMDKEV